MDHSSTLSYLSFFILYHLSGQDGPKTQLECHDLINNLCFSILLIQNIMLCLQSVVSSIQGNNSFFSSSSIQLQNRSQRLHYESTSHFGLGLLPFFFRFLFIYFWRKEKGRETCARETSISCLSPPTGDLAHNPGMSPDWASNWQTFGPQAGTQSTELHQPGQGFYLNYNENRTCGVRF